MNPNPRIRLLLRMYGASDRLYALLDPRFGHFGLRRFSREWPKERLLRELRGYGPAAHAEWMALLARRRRIFSIKLSSLMKTLLIFLIGACCGAWWGSEIRSALSPVAAVSGPASITSSTPQALAESFPQGLRAITGLQTEQLLLQHNAARDDRWRRWTHQDGRTIEAKLVARHAITVDLQTRDGTTHSVPIEHLTLPDRVWLSLLDTIMINRATHDADGKER
jgi:hypothetical protein